MPCYDVCNNIIDHLDLDRPTLAACIQVSRWFRDRSAIHLFHTITILSDMRLVRLQEDIRNPLCYFPRHVKRLVLGHPKTRRAHSGCAPLTVDCHTLWNVLSALPGLTSGGVIVQNISWAPSPLAHELPCSEGSTFNRQSNRLHLLSAQAPSITSSIASQRALIVPHSSVSFRNPSLHPELAEACTTTVAVLGSDRATVDALANPTTLGTIKDLVLHIYNPQTLHAAERLFQALQNGIARVSVRWCDSSELVDEDGKCAPPHRPSTCLMTNYVYEQPWNV